MNSIGHVDPLCGNVEELPPVSITLDGLDLVMTPNDYLIKSLDPFSGTMKCMAAFMPLDVPAPRGPLWVLGDSFLRAYYTVYDKEARTVGIAKAVHGVTVNKIDVNPGETIGTSLRGSGSMTGTLRSYPKSFYQ